jgi:hypothetical protein
MESMSRSEFFKTISTIPNGAMFSVMYTKKDGTQRELTTVKGTRQGVKGVGLNYDPASKGYLILYDVQLARRTADKSKCWRTVTYDSITMFKWAGIIYQIT